MLVSRLVTRRPLLARQLVVQGLGRHVGDRHVGSRHMGFTATSKALKSKPVDSRWWKADVHDILQRSAVLKQAFSTQEPDAMTGTVSPGGIEIIQHSGAAGSGRVTLPATWGLVSTIMECYNTHHELELRPDDFWQAILTQFSFYVNGRAEALRDRIVDFQGKKRLVVDSTGRLFTADFGKIASCMVDEQIAENIRDPELAQWLIPSFTTTNENDRIVAAVTVMATLQAYFKYEACLLCGIPKVTLLGTVADWQQLRSKIDRLLEFDLEDQLMTKWHKLLSPVVEELVRSADGHPDVSFWDCIVNHVGGGSGPRYLSGWAAVFAVFSNEGRWMGNLRDKDTWPQINFDSLPESAMAVPLHVNDNGVKYDTYMLAGQMAMEVLDSGVGLCTRSDWCIAYTCQPQTKPEEGEAILIAK